MKLNTNISINHITDDTRIKYQIVYKHINSLEVQVSFLVQDNRDIIIFNFIDKLISVPKLNANEILVERRVNSKNKQIFLIDIINPQILLIKSIDINKKGGKTYINTPILKSNHLENSKNIKKIITIDIEARNNLDILKNIGDFSEFTPIVIAGYIPLENRTFYTNLFPTNDERFYDNMTKFLSNIIQYKYHTYRVYAHNLMGFDIIFIYKILLKYAEKNDIKIEPLFREERLISIKCKFGRYINTSSYRYYIEFHDSYLKLPNSLDKLSRSFIEDSKFHKLDTSNVINYLISEAVRNKYDSEIQQATHLKIREYCIQDCKILAEVLIRFGYSINNEFNINIHSYPTLSSIAFNIYLTKYLPNLSNGESKTDSCIPLITGNIYKDIKNAYHGGHTDVYELYSNEEVHSYDYTSMYPTQMVKHEMPVGKITKFIGNPFVSETFESLCKQHCFMKCTISVDKSLNRPLYQTIIKINDGYRSVCATGTFLNQWVYLPEICKYYELTNGFRFNRKKIFIRK